MENLTVIIAKMKVSEKAHRTLKTAKMLDVGRISMCSPNPMCVAVISGQRKPGAGIVP